MTEKFVWPADVPLMEYGRAGRATDGRPAWVVKTIRHYSLNDPLGWSFEAKYQHGNQPWTLKTRGKTTARSGLLSRRGYIRIIREDIGVIERDVMISELKALAKSVLHGRDKAIFERRVLGPLTDPLGPKPSIQELALQYGISEKRAYKIITRCWRKIEAEHWRQEQEQEAKRAMNGALASFAVKRQTGGITYQHDGQFWDLAQLRVTKYSTSVNTAATAISSSNTTYRDYNNNE